MKKKDENTLPFETTLTETELQKLEEIFMVNGSDEDACFYAGISPRKLYYYQEQNPDYLQRKKALKNMPKLKAKKVLSEALDKRDKDIAKFILERTDREYSTKQKVEVDNRRPIIEVYSEDAKEQLSKLRSVKEDAEAD